MFYLVDEVILVIDYIKFGCILLYKYVVLDEIFFIIIGKEIDLVLKE